MNNSLINPYMKYDTRLIAKSPFVNWEMFKNSTVLITGATGFIGLQTGLSLAIASMTHNLNINIILLCRDKRKAKILFNEEISFAKIKIIEQDVNKKINYKESIDYIIHTASNTSSKSFVETPVETIDTTINGTKNILELAKEKHVKGVVYLSSMEVYGAVNSDIPVKETDLGYIDLLNERNSYPQAKRTAETLCYSYFKEYNAPVKIARLCQIIGANIPYNDTRVFAQFARNVIEDKDIILHTDGSTVRNYCYITDCVTAILKILTEGVSGEAYNVANKNAVCSIKEMAEKIMSKYGNRHIIYDITTDRRYLPAIKLCLNPSKLESLGWKAEIPLDKMFVKLINGLLHQKSKSLKYKSNYKLKIKDYIKLFINIRTLYNYKLINIGPVKFKINRQKLYKYIYKKFPVKNNKILFCNYQGLGYGCNPKYIAEELLRQNLNMKIVWLTKDKKFNKNIPKNVKIVDYKNELAIYEHATSKVWIDNYHKNYFIKKGLEKKESQIYIQTWHGSLGIKKLDRNVQLFTDDKQWVNVSKKNSAMTDFLLSNCDWETEIFKNAFWDIKNIIKTGHPRNDILFRNNDNLKIKINNKYKTSKNIILYVPTFREDLSLDVYNLNYKKLTQTFKEKFGKDFIFFTKFHPRVQDFADIIIPPDVINVSDYPDIQELLAVADIAITDYSSCIFDFMLTKRPGFIYATDIEEYNNERGFYYPLEQTPFPIARNNDELIQNILNFDYENYKQKVEDFLKEKGCMEDGHASERVVELIKQYINQ